MEAGYRWFCVPVDAGPIPASFLSEAKPVLGIELSVHFRVRTPDKEPVPASPAADVHRRVLERRIAASGRTHDDICVGLGWDPSRLLWFLDRLEYEDLFAVLEVVGVSREEYFEEVCLELAKLESRRREHGGEGREPPKVCDLMRLGEDVPRVESSRSMRDTIYAMAGSKLGVIAVTDAEDRLVGSISDADLRGLLMRDELSLDRTAGEHVTPNPRTVDGDAPATVALKLMEEHRITLLFVCDAAGRLEGVVHLHDLWRIGLF